MKTQWSVVMKEVRVPKRYRLRVQERLVVLEYVTETRARRFGFDRKTIRRWLE